MGDARHAELHQQPPPGIVVMHRAAVCSAGRATARTQPRAQRICTVRCVPHLNSACADRICLVLRRCQTPAMSLWSCTMASSPTTGRSRISWYDHSSLESHFASFWVTGLQQCPVLVAGMHKLIVVCVSGAAGAEGGGVRVRDGHGGHPKAVQVDLPQPAGARALQRGRASCACGAKPGNCRGLCPWVTAALQLE